MRRAAIVSPLRSAVGVFGGSLRSVPVEKMSAAVISAILERTGISPKKSKKLSLHKVTPAAKRLAWDDGQH